MYAIIQNIFKNGTSTVKRGLVFSSALSMLRMSVTILVYPRYLLRRSAYFLSCTLEQRPISFAQQRAIHKIIGPQKFLRSREAYNELPHKLIGSDTALEACRCVLRNDIACRYPPMPSNLILCDSLVHGHCTRPRTFLECVQ
jgi:hypothetical protein